MENIRNLIACAASLVGAYFAPVESIFVAIGWIFILNFAFGFLDGKVRKGEDFSFKKAFQCMVEALVIFLLMASIYFVGEKIGKINGAIQCISGVVYAIIYFYGTNILKNLKSIFPGSKLIAFLYYVVSIEFIKKLPILSAYLTNKENKENG